MRRSLGIAVAAFALLLSGCVQPFLYKPPPRASDVPHFPYRVAVFGFEDGTEDFIQTGGRGRLPWVFNLAKGGGAAVGIPQLSPDMWARFFADDLRQSGMFEEVNALFSRTAFSHENLIIRGTVLRAELAMHTLPCDFSLKLTATLPNKERPLWEETFSQKKALTLSSCPSQKCGLRDINQFLQLIFQDIFAEARRSLAEALKASATTP